jgi:hypothetical protein
MSFPLGKPEEVMTVFPCSSSPDISPKDNFFHTFSHRRVGKASVAVMNQHPFSLSLYLVYVHMKSMDIYVEDPRRKGDMLFSKRATKGK